MKKKNVLTLLEIEKKTLYIIYTRWGRGGGGDTIFLLGLNRLVEVVRAEE